MKRFRFAFVSNSEEVAEAVQTCADPTIEHVALNLATMEAAVPVARQLLAEGVEVIIGGGGTGGLLAESIGQPVVKLDRSSLDLLRALIEARQIASDIAITSFAKPVEGVDLYQELLSVRIRQVIFSRSEELRAGIKQAIGDGCRVVVGGGICRQIATRFGASGMVVMPRKENVIQTLREARAIAAARRMERRSLEEIHAILFTAREGIIVLDRSANVKFLNEAAIEIFKPVLPNADHAALVGNRVPGALEPLGLAKVLRDGTPETDKVRRVGSIDLVVSSLPIMVDGEMVGAVSTTAS